MKIQNKFFKKWTKQLLKQKHENIIYGDVFTFSTQFLDDSGNPIENYKIIKNEKSSD